VLQLKARFSTRVSTKKPKPKVLVSRISIVIRGLSYAHGFKTDFGLHRSFTCDQWLPEWCRLIFLEVVGWCAKSTIGFLFRIGWISL
jgi:hypothetical protein